MGLSWADLDAMPSYVRTVWWDLMQTELRVAAEKHAAEEAKRQALGAMRRA